MAEYPGSAYTPNPQDTSNDVPGDTTIANASDYNKHDEEIQAVTDDLRSAIAAGTGANMAAVVTNLTASVITTPGVDNTIPGDLVLWDDSDGTALRQGNAVNGGISVSNETVNPLVLGDGELVSTNGDLAIKAENALILEATGDKILFWDGSKFASEYTGSFSLSGSNETWSYLAKLFGERSLMQDLYSAAVGGTERAILVEDFYGDLDTNLWTMTGGVQAGQDLIGGVTEFQSGVSTSVEIKSVRKLFRREQNPMLDVRFLLNDVTDLNFFIRVKNAISTISSFLQLQPGVANFFAACTNGGPLTAVDTGVTAATGTWYRLIIQESASNAVFRLGEDYTGDIYPAVVATITTNLPTSTEAREIQIALADVAAASKSVQIDWIRVAADREA